MNLFAIEDTNQKPLCDIGICSECGWRGDVINCRIEQEGSWEEGYHDVHLCPVCKDGGCIDDYDYSTKQYIKWVKWNHKTNIKPRCNHE